MSQAQKAFRWTLRHKLARYRGGYRLQRIILFFSPRLFDVRIGGLPAVWVDPRIDTWTIQELLVRSPCSEEEIPDFEAHVQSIARQLVRPTDTIVDVGAHIGWHTVLFDTLVPQGRVLAFEPNPLLQEGLRKTVAGLKRTELYNCALGEFDGEVRLHLPEDLSQATVAGDANTGVACRQRRLDDCADRADFLKVDVEGAELLVFRGASRLLDRPDAPVVLFEEIDAGARAFGLARTAAKDYLESLTKPRYRFWTIHRDGQMETYRLPRPVWCDVLAVPSSRMSQCPMTLALLDDFAAGSAGPEAATRGSV